MSEWCFAHPFMTFWLAHAALGTVFGVSIAWAEAWGVRKGADE